MAQLWERQKDENGKLEPIKAYAYFHEYLMMGSSRSLSKLCEKIGKKKGYVRQLETYSSKWHWVERVSAYEEHLYNTELKEQEDYFRSLRRKELPNLKSRVASLNKNFLDIEKQEGLKPSDKIGFYEKNTRAYKNVMDGILSLLGKPEKIKIEGNMDIKQTNLPSDKEIGMIIDELSAEYDEYFEGKNNQE